MRHAEKDFATPHSDNSLLPATASFADIAAAANGLASARSTTFPVLSDLRASATQAQLVQQPASPRRPSAKASMRP